MPSLMYEVIRDDAGRLIYEASKMSGGWPWEVRRRTDGATRKYQGSRAQVRSFMRKWAKDESGNSADADVGVREEATDCVEWRDETSYSRSLSVEHRVPRTWTTYLPGVGTVVVTRHLDMGEEWTLNARGFGIGVAINLPLGTDCQNEARRKALSMVHERCVETINNLESTRQLIEFDRKRKREDEPS